MARAERNSLRHTLPPQYMGSRMGYTALRLRALLPDNGLSRDIPAIPGLRCAELHPRMSSGLQSGFLRFGSRCRIGNSRLWSQPCGLVVHPRWSHLGYGTYPPRLPRTAHLPILVAADGVCTGRWFFALYVFGTGGTTAAEQEL